MATARILAAFAAVVIGLCSWSAAGVPHYMNYQGRLMGSDGTPVNATVQLTVTIYSDGAGSTPIFVETHPGVAVEDGLFNLLLGEYNGLPTSLFNGQIRYIGVQVDDGPTASPNMAIVSTAYSFRSVYADTANVALNATGGNSGWVDDGTRVRLAGVGDSVGIGTSSPSSPLEVVGAGTAIIGQTTGSGTMVGVMGTSEGGAIGVMGTSGSYSGVLGASNDGTGIHGVSVTGFAGAFYGPKSYFSGDVGIGVTDPERRLDVSGPATAINGLSSGSVNSAGVRGEHSNGGRGVIGTSDDGIGVAGFSQTGYSACFYGPKNFFNGSILIAQNPAEPTEKLQIREATIGERAFIQIETASAAYWGECGIRFKTPDNTWHFRMDDYTNNNLPIAGSLSLRSQDLNQEVMTWANNGRVGIGDSSPEAKLDVNGDLRLTGAYRGNTSSSSGSDGAPFPRPAYNSGWITVTVGDCEVLTHNIGGGVDDYFVDLQMKHPSMGLVNLGFGGTLTETGQTVGTYYEHLTTTQIWVCRAGDDFVGAEVRIRIWVIN